MERFYYIVLIIIVNNIVSSDCANNTENDYPALNPNWPYCFEFTWFGPDYDNVSTYNNTCADYLDETRAKGVPCAAPIVISYDGTLPNMQYLWDKHKASILCKRSINQRCVKYTYYFNNHIANITYKCAKVQQSNGGFIDSGCYKQKLIPGYESEVCVCKSTTGIYPPCNKSSMIVNNYFNIIGVFFLVKYFI
ncbi:unnamed protein product [Psylliodes chrysocephalus]|uniref:Uncharacterized protein n=1 Tax=Psylliodes chrysocephalus TaxID=3402493 RepID=A0A9P0D933_9CUCU|nr:unnamed protein product [Psylliodes chrysocephala]